MRGRPVQPAGAQVTETIAKKRMIAAANPHAAKAGLDMMRAGGSAVDAAIATQLALVLPSDITDRFDIVGVDPRGLGSSDIDCGDDRT